jgi:ADP-heptose:LPS heptosyltransferase
MNIRTMRTIDRVVGIPLCWIAGAALTILARRKIDPARHDVKHVLFIKFFGLGSVILSTSALSMVRSKNPESSLSFLTFSSNRGLLERLPLIDEILTVDPSNPWTFSKDLLAILKRLIRVRYDVVFDFEFFSKFSTLLSAATLAPIRVGFELPARWRSSLLTHSVPLVKGGHVKDAFCSQVQVLFEDSEPEDLVVPSLTDEDSEVIERRIGLHTGQIIVVNVNAGDTFLERRWPPERFASLITELSLESDFLFVLTGIATEREYVQSVIDKALLPQRCRNLAGQLTVPELGALLRLSSLVISNDSGPLHLAAVLGVPTIGLFGPESPAFYGPVGYSATSIYKKISCSPCMNVYDAKTFRCPYDARCMKNIQISDVKTVIDEVFAVA